MPWLSFHASCSGEDRCTTDLRLLRELLRFAAEVLTEVAALDDHAEDVFQGKVRLLDVHGGVAGDDDVEVGEGGHAAAVVAGVGDGVDLHFPGFLEGLDAVFTVAGGGDGEKDVAGVGEGFDLALEDVVVRVVVGDGGEDAGVGGQRHRAEGRAIDSEAGDELGDEVLGVGGATAVAADHEFSALLHGVGGEAAGVNDGLMDGLVVEDFGEGVERLLELLAD